MKRWLAIAGVVLLAGALVFFNQGVKKSAAPEEEEKPAAAQSTPGMPGVPSSDPGAALMPEETIGDPRTAKHHIEMGWVYDENNQQKPETLAVPIQSVREVVAHMPGTVSAVIVNLDIPSEDRSPAAQAVTDLGIQVDGQSLLSGNPSDIPLPEGTIMKQLNEAVNKK